MATMTATRRNLAAKLDHIAAQLAAVTAELRVPEPPRPGVSADARELAVAVNELTDRIKRLEKAASQPPRRAYRPSEVAAMVGCSAQTVRDLIHGGRLEAVDMGGWYAIAASAVEKLLES